MANERESKLEARCGTKVKALGGRFIKLVGLTGIPDRLILLPFGVICFVEFKTSAGVLSSAQIAWHNAIVALGFKCYTIRSVEEFDNLLTQLTGVYNA